VILRMSRVRILGPRSHVDDVFSVLQDLEVVHLDDEAPDHPGLGGEHDPEEERLRRLRQLRRAVDVVSGALEGLGRPDAEAPVREPSDGAGRGKVARWVRLARRVLRRHAALERRIGDLEEEQALLERSRAFFRAFAPLLEGTAESPETTSYQVILDEGAEVEEERIRRALERELGEGHEVRFRRLDTGETAFVLLVPSELERRTDEILSGMDVRELPVSDRPAARSPDEALERAAGRLARVSRELESLRSELGELARRRAPELARAEAVVRDRILELEAMSAAAFTARAFVVSGWIPTEEVARTERALRTRVGDAVVVEEVAREEWAGEEAPVVLRNPRIFRPFESVVTLLPLPRYGTMDPTPFVAVVFPMFFGLILGDVAYGALLAVVAVVLHRRSEAGTLLRSAAEIAGACAAFTVIFGFLFGELLGDLGSARLGLEPILFHREEALLPFLGLAVAIGAVHLLLGLLLAVLAAFRRNGAREAAGPGIMILMVIVVIVAILAAVEVLPGAFFTPAVIGALVAFPILVAVEGLVAPVELLSTLGRILSYARIMALGTASVMMAVAANRMIGGLGSLLVGALFALLFHAVNFVLGVFSPTIHALRLHYVEFFGTFYSTGGTEYRPFGHWKGLSARDA